MIFNDMRIVVLEFVSFGGVVQEGLYHVRNDGYVYCPSIEQQSFLILGQYAIIFV